MRIHIVQKGDTLWKIAQKYGVDFQALKGANTQLSNPDLIMPGMKIKVPTGSVQASPVKNETVKEQPVKEQPMKEMPKEVKTPPPSVKEEKEAPIAMPAPPQPSPSYHTDIDLNIYQQHQQMQISAPPKMPKPKEAPKVKEKPVVKKPVEKKPVKKPEVKKPVPVQPKAVKPMTKPMPMKQQLPQDCYPVPPFMPCPPPCPPGYQPMQHHMHQPMYHGMPAPGYAFGYGQPNVYPGMGAGAPVQSPMGMGVQGNQGMQEEQMNGNEMPSYGDVTAHEYQTPQNGVLYPTGLVPTPQAGYGVPQFQGYGAYPYPMQYQQHQGQGQQHMQGTWRQDEDEDN